MLTDLQRDQALRAAQNVQPIFFTNGWKYLIDGKYVIPSVNDIYHLIIALMVSLYTPSEYTSKESWPWGSSGRILVMLDTDADHFEIYLGDIDSMK